MLFPTFNFAYVQDDIFRGSYPKSHNWEFLQHLNIKTILSLTPDPLIPSSKHLFTLLHVSIPKPKDSLPITFTKIFQILHYLTDTQYHPIYIHCLDGITITTIAIMSLRKLQQYSAIAWTMEASRFTHQGVLTTEEKEFMNKLQGEFEIPNQIPKWLWNGIPPKKHAYFKIKSSPNFITNTALSISCTSASASNPSTPLEYSYENQQTSKLNTEISINLQQSSISKLQIEKDDLRGKQNISAIEDSTKLDQEFKSNGGSNNDNEINDENISRTLDALLL